MAVKSMSHHGNEKYVISRLWKLCHISIVKTIYVTMSRHDIGTDVCNQHYGSTNVGGIPRQDQTSLDAVNNDNICGAWRWTTLYGTVQLEFGVGHHSAKADLWLPDIFISLDYDVS